MFFTLICQGYSVILRFLTSKLIDGWQLNFYNWVDLKYKEGHVVDDKIQAAYQQWADQPNLPADILLDLNKMKNDSDKKKDAFGTNLSFGTAGMRGILGAGTNRMNIYTVRQAAEGLASFMDTLDDATKKRLPSALTPVTTQKSLPTNPLKSWDITTFQPLYSTTFAPHLNCHSLFVI